MTTIAKKDTSQRYINLNAKSTSLAVLTKIRIFYLFQSYLPIIKKIFVDICLVSTSWCQFIAVKPPLIIFTWILKKARKLFSGS